MRFEEEIAAIDKTWGSAGGMPERFLQDITKLDQAAGIALGVDRLCMLALGVDDIRGVVSFSPEDLL